MKKVCGLMLVLGLASTGLLNGGGYYKTRIFNSTDQPQEVEFFQFGFLSPYMSVVNDTIPAKGNKELKIPVKTGLRSVVVKDRYNPQNDPIADNKYEDKKSRKWLPDGWEIPLIAETGVYKRYEIRDGKVVIKQKEAAVMQLK